MRVAKLKLIGAAATAMVVVAGGLTVAVSQEKGTSLPTKASPVAKPVELPPIPMWDAKTNPCPRFTDPNRPIDASIDDPMKLAALERLKALRHATNLYRQLIESGSWNGIILNAIIEAYRQTADAAADVYGPSAESLEWYRERVAMVAWFEDIMRKRLEAATVAPQDVFVVTAQRYQALGEYLKLRRKVEGK